MVSANQPPKVQVVDANAIPIRSGRIIVPMIAPTARCFSPRPILTGRKCSIVTGRPNSETIEPIRANHESERVQTIGVKAEKPCEEDFINRRERSAHGRADQRNCRMTHEIAAGV